MKQYFVKRMLAAGFVLLTVPAVTFAQNEDRVEKKEIKEKKDVQQIIITRKGNKDDKTVIEIKGDKVTVNGKDVSKIDDITVNLNNLSDLRAMHWEGNRDFNFDLNHDLNLDLNHDLNNNRVSLFSEDANRAMLGVLTDEADEGAKITSITKESGAEKAGLKVGDVITKIGDDAIDDADDVSRAVRKHKPGDKITVSVLRNGRAQKLTAELGKWKGVTINNINDVLVPAPPMEPSEPGAPARPGRAYTFSYGGNNPKLGLSVQDTEDGKGVKVLQVAEESSAAKAGVKKDDVITQIDGDEVNTTDEVVHAMRDARNEPAVKLQILRNGKTQDIEVRIPRKLKTADL